MYVGQFASREQPLNGDELRRALRGRKNVKRLPWLVGVIYDGLLNFIILFHLTRGSKVL